MNKCGWIFLALLSVAASSATAQPSAAGVAAAPATGGAASAPQDPKAQLIIRNADRIRAPEEPFRYTLTLEEFRQGRSMMQQVLDISMRFRKPAPGQEQGDTRGLVRFVSPARDKGKSMFYDYEKMWYYAPDLRRPIPISKQQRLIGQIANGDIAAADFGNSYTSRIEGEEACGSVACYRLELVRRWSYVTYPKIVYWVEKATGRPYRADFLSTSDLLIKRAWYKDFRVAAGVARPHQIVVEDALQKDNYTTMTYSDLRLETLPESYFQKDYLMRLN